MRSTTPQILPILATCAILAGAVSVAAVRLFSLAAIPVMPPVPPIAPPIMPVPAAAEDPKPYTETIPGTDVKFDMVPIPGGEFVMGSSAQEKGRNDDEGPQHPVAI